MESNGIKSTGSIELTAAERELVKKGDIKEDEIPWLRTLAQKYKQREEEVEKMNPPLKFWDSVDIIEPGRQGEDNQEQQEEDELDEPAPNNKSKKTPRRTMKTGVFKKAMKMFKRRKSVKQKEEGPVETMEIDLTDDDKIAAPSSSKKRPREDDRRGSLRSAQPKKKFSCFSVLDEEDFDD